MLATVLPLTTLFWMWMIYDCAINEPKGSSWLWMLIVLNFPGAVIYFIARKLPYLNIPLPAFLRQWTMKDALWNAEAGVMNIGKSHQYVTLGNVLTEMGNLDRALECYREAINREATNTNALWGCATIEMHNKRYELAREYLQALLDRDPEYKRGEASLQYGKALYELQVWAEAKAHFEMDIKRWGHAESFLLLAKTVIHLENDRLTAKQHLETMLARLKASPRYNYRKNSHLIRSAQKMLKGLG